MKRTENIKVKMELEKEAGSRHQLAIELLNGSISDLLEGDLLTVNWEFFIEYFGDISLRLKAVNKLCNDPDVVVSADCKLLEEGQCLIFETLSNLKQLIQTIKRRE